MPYLFLVNFDFIMVHLIWQSFCSKTASDIWTTDFCLVVLNLVLGWFVQIKSVIRISQSSITQYFKKVEKFRNAKWSLIVMVNNIVMCHQYSFIPTPTAPTEDVDHFSRPLNYSVVVFASVSCCVFIYHEFAWVWIAKQLLKECFSGYGIAFIKTDLY